VGVGGGDDGEDDDEGVEDFRAIREERRNLKERAAEEPVVALEEGVMNS